MAAPDGTPHLPTQVRIDAYGAGGFRFGDMSHRGSLLALPSGMWAWPPCVPDDLDAAAFARPLAEAAAIDLLVVGTGRDLVPLAEPVAWRLRDGRLRFEVMATPAAARTYSVLLGEGRRTAAALLAVD